MNDRLHRSRAEIDRLDREFIRLLAARMRAVREIGSYKNGAPEAPLRDEERERQLFTRWAKDAEEEGLSSYFVGRVLREVLNYSRRDQERLLNGRGGEPGARSARVGYQGVPACYSDLTIAKVFAGRDVARLERQGFRSFSAVVDALEAGDVDYALLPIENTIAGSINEVYDLLARRAVTIVGEEVWAVEHCLVGLSGATLEGLEVIRSHPVALQQCQRFLDGLVGCVAESHHDTAGAAESVAAEGRPEVAALCSEEAAQHYGLQVLRRDVSDQHVNLTRFLLIAKEPEPCDPRQPAKTSLVLSVDHRQGALLACLQALAAHGINLTKLESRPQPSAPWEYLFYVDLLGHADEPAARAALAELREHTNQLKVLGSYPRHAAARDAALAPALESLAAEPTAPPPPPPPTVPAAPRSDLPLSSARASGERTVVRVGPVEIGAQRFVLIAGPCAVESRAQVLAAAELVRENGASILRGGAFKPRSSPYAFQGLGFPGLDLLVEAGRAFEMPVVTEVLRPEDVEAVAERADMLQVGARNMQNFALLREIGRTSRPVLLKRGLSATISELVQAAEYVMAGGNHRVVLCERGIRTFETAVRNTLDVSAVPVLRERTHLPILVDPSHAAGRRELVVPLALAAAAVGADGLIVEAHPNPAEALCDKEQALTGDDLRRLRAGLRPIVESQGRTL